MFALDPSWLGVVAKRFDGNHMGTLRRPDVTWAPALLFYLLHLAAVVVFVVRPAAERRLLGRAVAR